MIKRNIKYDLAFLLLLAQQTLAANIPSYVEVDAGSRNFAEGRSLFPIFMSNNNAIFTGVDGAISGTTDLWRAGSMLGFNHLDNGRIYGTFCRFDYNRIDSGNKYWVLVPGIQTLPEELGVGFSSNVYLPLTGKKQAGSNYTQTSYANHDSYSQTYGNYQNFQKGIDYGISLKSNLFGFLVDTYGGGYQFLNTNNSGNVNGATIKIGVNLFNYCNLGIKESYDNVNKNKIEVAFGISIGSGSSSKVRTIDHNHSLMSLVKRNNVANSVNTSPSYNVAMTKGLPLLTNNNNWFFKPAGGDGGDGTIENPYLFNNDNLLHIRALEDNITPKSLFFAPSGNNPYDLSLFTDNTLPNNFSLYGRSDLSFLYPATLGQVVFNGNLNINSGTSILNSISMIGSNPGNQILMTSGAQTTVTLQGVSITNDANSGSGGSGGICAMSGSTINFDSGTNSVTGTGDTQGNYGIYLDSSIVNFNGGTANILGTGAGATNYGINIITNSAGSPHVNFNGGNVNIAGINGVTGYGIYAAGADGMPAYVNFADSLTNKVNINYNTCGIYTHDGVDPQVAKSYLQINNENIQDGNGAQLDRFVNFQGSSPNAIDWEGFNNIITR